MATITKATGGGLADMLLPASHKIRLPAGEAIAAKDFCYIKSDGKIWRANGTAATAPALAVGIAAVAQGTVGEPVTIIFGCQVNYGTGLTPGARYYASATAGAIDDAATTGGTVPVAFAVDTTNIFVLPPTR